ncbi:ataxin-3-like isoform X4 [Panulirus ornatus]|uniref:ataxin-3-like isoform X4 n=1 Tax=Panulirus ornatus TaxID=150431 RepID=UPI003A86474B
MELVYHEKQDGLLCGQHCLNNLLQGQYFSAVDLADIAQQMDQAEQHHMAELGMHTDDFRRFMEQPSVNMDDSGMFSVQVLTSALRVWDLSLVPYASNNPLARAARGNPTEQQAYICNFKEHWLTVRKLGHQWFNLNSLLTHPELISSTYLSLFLTQLQHEGYSIFVVDGQLPPSEADETLRLHPAQQTTRPRLLSEVSDEARISKEDSELKAVLAASLAKVGPSVDNTSRPSRQEDYDNLQAAIQMSLQGTNHGKAGTASRTQVHSDDDDLERALQLSLCSEEKHAIPAGQDAVIPTSEDECLQAAIRMSLGQHSPEAADEDLKRALQLSLSSKTKQALTEGQVAEGSSSEEEHLQKALSMSLDEQNSEDAASNSSLQPDPEEIRKRRLAFLSKKTP